MIDSDPRLRAIRDTAREAAADLRARALAIDADPDAMADHLDSPTYALIRRAETPGTPQDPDRPLPTPTACLENVVGMVELAHGDVGTLLACPSPGLAGVLVELLGDADQKARFHARLADGRGWSCFAMSEEAAGSDATAMTTRLTPDGAGGWLLHGAKRYIGQGARAAVGVVFARTGPSPLAIRAALVELPLPGWHAEPLQMVGLRGAHLSELRFDGVPIAAADLLGQQLPVTRRGIWAATRTFHRMRVRVAAAAVGTALAMTGYVADHRKTAPELPLAQARAEAARQLVYQAAARVDADPDRGHPAHLAKLGATRLATDLARWAGAALGPAALLEHPLLEKWTRDVRAFEFMEGTGTIQRLHIARGHRNGDADG
ncbi:acyl-CoA dehydrogenase family protein [Streptomyces sp. DSM 44915]|uniref:Acyl-CoA dehydrogenase family protein n=1 Tax=Streptomyces chisholmiae TaxID=3075540 RepID=A0ABU2JQY1_9ACTN|nr:acyl-CoA dehydrogenase family protein [Streptomyces sp. DSM 44915]MDT0267380.1 acyl-CoA dehydrogenase family protein [Streptomyces sp. DSM 44915]